MQHVVLASTLFAINAAPTITSLHLSFILLCFNSIQAISMECLLLACKVDASIFGSVRNAAFPSLRFCLQDEVQHAMLYCAIVEHLVFVFVSQFELVLMR